MTLRTRLYWALGSLALVGGAMAMAPAAHAAIPPTRIVLPGIGASSDNPDGQSVNASNWGGFGNNSICNPVSPNFGQGVVNDTIGVWKNSGAGCASDWQLIQLTATPIAAGGTFQIQFNPKGTTVANLCLSTIANIQGTRARLRPCAPGGNPWQTFHEVPVVSDILGGFMIEGTTGLALNDLRYAQNTGLSIASWTALGTVNETFLFVS